MQSKVGVAQRKKKAFNYSYADLNVCWEACEDALQDARMAILQFPIEAPAGQIGLLTKLVFADTGEVIEEKAYLPIKNPTDPQAAGSGYTYLRRYALSAIVGIRTEDDDGNAAKTAPKPPVQAYESVGAYRSQFTRQQEDKQNDKATMKALYKTVQAANIGEPDKSNLLNDIGAYIKAMPKETTK